MRASTAPSTVRLDVEVLRGVAVALVIADHAFGLPSGGYLGVDVFFVLSGFVITRSLLAEHRRAGRIDLVAFAARRVRRLLPAALLVVLVTAAVSAALWYRPRTLSVLGDAVAAVLGTTNWHLARAGTDYFGETAPSPFRHFWSLAVEEQFYALWPVVLWVLLAVVRHRIGILLVVSALVATGAVAAVVHGPLAGADYFNTILRSWELLIGAVVALAPRLPLGSRAAIATRTIAVAAVGAGVLVADPRWAATVPVVVGTALLVASGDLRSAVAVRLARPLIALGRVSYSAYLWHWPALVVAAVVAPGPLGAGCAVVVALVLAALSTRFVEEPLRTAGRSARRGRRRRGPGSSRARLVAVAAPVTVLVMSVSTVVAVDPASVAAALDRPVAPPGPTAPFRDADALADAVSRAADARSSDDRAPDARSSDDRADAWSSDARLADAAQQTSLPRSMQDGGCLVTPGAPLRTCGDPGTVDVLVLGDSTTVAWSPAVIGALPDGATHAVVGVSSCSAVLPTAKVAHRWDRACRASKRAMLRAVEEKDPSIVVISAVAGDFREHLLDIAPDGAEELWRRSMAETIAALAVDGRKVVVLSAPQYGPDVRSCPDRLHGFAACAASVTPDAAAKRTAEAAAVASSPSRAVWLDAGSWLCTPTSHSCPPVIDGTLVRVDEVHLTEAFSRRLVPLVRDAVDWDGLLRR
ncbi:acyltransferase family protein [Curtobacterium sp. MCPF17_002]|uniref:acyltransferase family protein n=1 Tax=Curtobacterium sp. MCPF17_002 TaxID=2175645 RepID=UPI000DA7810F|nr:acyltransferase family protein [Curtobacterium sp. MCPF17_002]WIB79110.1 acyltransferase family protein [Curtobacterium sp. MCPF17_002]